MSGVGGAGGAGAAAASNVFRSRFVAGVTNMANGTAQFTVTFPNVGTNSYSVDMTVQNTVDPSPRHLIGTVKTKTTTSFTFQTAQTTNSTNYKANWILYLDAKSDVIPVELEEGGDGVGKLIE